jgi:phosphatidate cytidylyltransferase
MVSGPIALLPAWFLLAYIHGSGSQGPALALSVMVIIWAADVGAYLIGRRFGRVKLARQISPGKTWEGVIGGLISASVAALAAAALLNAPRLAFVSVALAATLVSVVGDLTVSMFKRYVGLKDSGRLLPGHGGVLDRIDSLSAAVPFFFVGLKTAGL